MTGLVLDGQFGAAFSIVAIFVISLILVFFKINLYKKKSKEKFVFGNAQLMGEKEYQVGYFSVLTPNASLLVCLADGILDNESGKYAAVLAVETFKQECRKGAYQKNTASKFFIETFKKIDKAISDNIFESNINVNVSAAIITGGFLRFAAVNGNTGGGSLFLLRGGNLVELSRRSVNSKIQTLKFKPNKNDIIMITSKGAAESLTEPEIIYHLSKGVHPHDKCQDLASLIQKKQLKNQKNATIIIVEQML